MQKRERERTASRMAACIAAGKTEDDREKERTYNNNKQQHQQK